MQQLKAKQRKPRRPKLTLGPIQDECMTKLGVGVLFLKRERSGGREKSPKDLPHHQPDQIVGEGRNLHCGKGTEETA